MTDDVRKVALAVQQQQQQQPSQLRDAHGVAGAVPIQVLNSGCPQQQQQAGAIIHHYFVSSPPPSVGMNQAVHLQQCQCCYQVSVRLLQIRYSNRETYTHCPYIDYVPMMGTSVTVGHISSYVDARALLRIICKSKP